MPTYSYRCPECGHEYQQRQRISDDSRAECPQCSARGERVISGGGGIVFKGSGFYITDYKRAGEKKASDDGKKAPKKDAKTDKTKTPPKSDAKTGSKDSSAAKPGTNS